MIYLGVTIWVDHLTSNYKRQNKVTGGGGGEGFVIWKRKILIFIIIKLLKEKKDAAVAFFKTQQFRSFSTKLTDTSGCVRASLSFHNPDSISPNYQNGNTYFLI